MSPRWLRPGLFSFLVLTTAFAGNLFVMQPPSKTFAPKRVEFGRAETQSPVSTAVPQQAAATPANAADAGVAAISTSSLPEAQPIAFSRPSPAETRAAALIETTGGNSAELTRAIQRELTARGYDTGSADGVPGLVTRAAIMAFESDHGGLLTGEPSETLLKSIVLGTDPAEPRAGTAAPSKEAAEVIRQVQVSMKKLGFYKGPADGRLSAPMERAIRDFEAHQGLAVTGRISGQLAARLARIAADSKMAENR